MIYLGYFFTSQNAVNFSQGGKTFYIHCKHMHSRVTLLGTLVLFMQFIQTANQAASAQCVQFAQI